MGPDDHDTGGAWMQPVILCTLLSVETVWEMSVDSDGQ